MHLGLGLGLGLFSRSNVITDVPIEPSLPPALVIAKNAGDSASSNFNFTSLTFDSEDIDTDGCHSILSATDRITISAAINGRYGVIHAFAFLSSAVVNSAAAIMIRKNGALPVGTGMILGHAGANTNIFIHVETQPMLLVTADYYTVELHCSDPATVLEADSSALSLYVVG